MYGVAIQLYHVNHHGANAFTNARINADIAHADAYDTSGISHCCPAITTDNDSTRYHRATWVWAGRGA
jgi:hypothetical protein